MKQERLMTIILSPIVSEKGTIVADKFRQFVFKVKKDATKPEIKKAMELMFKVEVNSVQVCNVKGKAKMFKQKSGRRKDWKKAYITLKEGHDIDFVRAG
jgi:large subunit ribosomal protein L23